MLGNIVLIILAVGLAVVIVYNVIKLVQTIKHKRKQDKNKKDDNSVDE